LGAVELRRLDVQFPLNDPRPRHGQLSLSAQSDHAAHEHDLTAMGL
jgi:hypothetical protein